MGKTIDLFNENNWDFEEEDPIPDVFIGFEDFYYFLINLNVYNSFIVDFNENLKINYYYNRFGTYEIGDLQSFLNFSKKRSGDSQHINFAFTWTPNNNWLTIDVEWKKHIKKTKK